MSALKCRDHLSQVSGHLRKRSTARRGFVAVAAALLVLLAGLVGCGGKPQTIVLAPLSAPAGSSFQSGAPAALVLTATNNVVPAATNLVVTLTPVTAPASGGTGTVTTAPTGLDVTGPGTYLVRFTVPAIALTAPTPYNVVASGTSTLTPFTTSPLTVTVQPAPFLQSVAPATTQQGTTLDVVLTGISTSFVNGTTRASFGSGIGVAGGASGTAGIVQVTSATLATAHLTVDANATLGAHDVTVTTGAQTVTLTGGFAVTAAQPAPVPPVASAGGPYAGAAGTVIAFSGAGSTDALGRALTYLWNFGDGSSATGVAPTHSYAAAGTYAVTLTVTNPDGLSATAKSSAVITAAPQPPVASAGGPYTGTAGQSVAFSAAGSSDPRGQGLTFAWNFGDGGAGTGVAPTHVYASAGTYTASVTVKNSDGLSATASATVKITAAPQAPVANAGGPYSGTTGTAVSFTGAASTDPAGQTLTYTWNFGDGSRATGVAPTHAYVAAGSYTVTLAVTNTAGLTSSATTTATINAPTPTPQPPVANAGGPYTGMAGTAVAFTGAGSTDPRGEVLAYAWNFGDGASAMGATPAHTYAASGTYTVRLTVTNTDALSATTTTTATIAVVAPTPQPPVANAGGPYTGVAGTAVAFSGGASTDPKGEVLTYAWNFGDGASGTGVAPAHTYATAGTYAITLTVTNTDALSATATAAATITAAPPTPQQPVANAGGPYTGTAGAAVSFTGAASTDPRGESLTYAWNFGDGFTGTGATTAHTYAAVGSYTVRLVVANTDGVSASATTTATIASAPPTTQPPIANAGGPYTGTAGTLLAFSGAASSDPKGEALTYAWNFGDGAIATGVATTHSYATAGTYTVSLTVTNTNSLSASASTIATITAANPTPQSPVANAAGPYTGTPGAAIAFNGSASSDPRGETLTYAWNFGDGTSGTGVSPSHAYGDAGVYTVTLTVSNTDNLSASASTTATIAAAAQPPISRAGGPYSGTTSISVRFDGTASTNPLTGSNGYGGLSFAWNFGDGSLGTGPSPVHTYTTAGTYTVTLIVANAAALSASATTAATITQGPPVSDLPNPNAGGPYTGQRGTSIGFSAAASTDPVGTALTYTWDFGDGTSGTGVSTSHTYAQAGTYSVVLTANNGTATNTASTTATIIAPPPQSVQANAGGPYTVAINQPLTLDGTGSTNPNTRQLQYTWDFGDGTTGSGSRPVHFYTSSGNFTVGLTVSDGLVASSTASAPVSVTGTAAETITAAAGGPYTEAAGRAVTFDATGSRDNLGNALTFAWNFGDGSTGTGATPTHTYAAAGNYTATVAATSGTATANATASVSIANAIAVTITSPTANTLFGNGSITVTGTVSAPNLTVMVNGVPAAVSGTGFTASNVSLREGVNLITATATDGAGGVGSGAVSVVLDVTAPRVSITSPASGAVLTSSQVAVAGLVNDSVTGTVGSNDVTVTVNGIAAQVSNRSYLLPSLQLVPGTNTITVAVSDRVGNTSQTTQTVQLVPPGNQLSLLKLSGDGQSGAAHSVLSQPLVVQLVAADGTPVAGRPITFTVTRSDGNVEVAPTVTQTLYVTTDAAGKASVLFQLGSRSGLGVNQVSATTPGAAGAAIFTASSTTGAATQIHVIRGENQRGLLGAPLAEAFQVIVQDAYGNPVPGVTVNYAVVSGDGSFPQSAVTTDSSGKASAVLTLGQQEGISNYTAQASFTGNAGLPVTFAASGYAPGPVANTSVSGIVLDNGNVPVANATVKLLGTSLITTTDASGRFKLTGAPVGTVTLSVDGSTSASTQTLPFLSFVLQDLPGQENTLGKPIYLPRIDVDNGQTVGGDDPVTLTIAGVPGVGFTVAPHSVTFPDGSTVGKLSLSLVKSDMVPMEPTAGTAPDLIWTLQPAGTRFSVPVQVTLPNTQALPPGTVSEMYQYDHDLEQFVSIGTGHVSADGSVMVSDAGFGITKAGWGHGAVTPVPPQCTQSCGGRLDECNTTYADQYCNCYVRALTGAVCGISPEGKKCRNPGHCSVFGVCNGQNKPDGTDCHTGPPKFCDAFVCKTGTCTDVPVPDQPLGTGNNDTAGNQGSKAQFTFQKIADNISAFMKTLGAPVDIKPIITAQDQVTLICCEVKKQLNVKTREQTVGGGINISTVEFPVHSPAPPFAPLGINIPRLGFQGVFAKIDGDVTGTITLREDQCTDTSCFKGGGNISINGTVGLNIQATDVLKLTVSGSTGFGGSFIAGCGSAKATIKFSGINANAQVTFLDLFQVTASAQVVSSTLSEYEYPFQ